MPTHKEKPVRVGRISRQFNMRLFGDTINVTTIMYSLPVTRGVIGDQGPPRSDLLVGQILSYKRPSSGMTLKNGVWITYIISKTTGSRRDLERKV